MARFYVDIPLICGETIVLPPEVVRHIHVLRMRQNEEITLFNGDGCSYIGSIIALDKKAVSVIINNRVSLEHQVCHSGVGRNPDSSVDGNQTELKLHLALSIIANDKMDLAISMATQLGVTSITPIASAYAQKLAVDKIEKRIEHWRKIIISSCEQCGRNYLPQLNLPVALNDFMSQQNEHQKIILSTTDAAAWQPSLDDATSILLLVGPEGGFSPKELELAVNNGYKAISLGQNILRSETAVSAGIATIQSKILR